MVIIPALADSVLLWMHVLEGVATETQACVYDRAGIGWSDPPPQRRRTPDLMAADFHALLSAAGIPPPYVLVGHSIGGMVARRSRARYPGMVAGILLIDSSHEDQATRSPQRTGGRVRPSIYDGGPPSVPDTRRRRFAAALGLVKGFDADIAREAPPEYADASAPSCCRRGKDVAVREMLLTTRTGARRPASAPSR